jgi:mycoredoxin
MTSQSRTTISAGDAAAWRGVVCGAAGADDRIAAMTEALDFLKDHTLAVYSATWCPDCQRLYRWLEEKKVPHQDVRIDQDEGAAEKLEQETGKQAIPFILVDGKTWVRGYHAEERSRFSESKLLAELRAAAGSRN